MIDWGQFFIAYILFQMIGAVAISSRDTGSWSNNDRPSPTIISIITFAPVWFVFLILDFMEHSGLWESIWWRRK